MDKVIGCITHNFANFNGRARRPEFWYFMLFYMIVFMATFFLDIMTGLYSEESDVGVISSLVSLGLMIPALAVGARRLHDINRTGLVAIDWHNSLFRWGSIDCLRLPAWNRRSKQIW